jgi:glycosyltransferase involved in cell wall biosynthesis
MLLSILICSIHEREEKLKRLIKKLNNTFEDVEIQTYIDDKQLSVGTKRNCLLNDAKGKYICFVDDDDDVCDNYIALLREGCLSDADCINLNGIITTNGDNPKLFIHSLKYNYYFEKDDVYYRPPNHLNTIKKSLVENFKFPNINNGEDTDWAMQICKSKVLKNEYEIKQVIYHYLYDTDKTSTQK